MKKKKTEIRHFNTYNLTSSNGSGFIAILSYRSLNLIHLDFKGKLKSEKLVAKICLRWKNNLAKIFLQHFFVHRTLI